MCSRHTWPLYDALRRSCVGRPNHGATSRGLTGLTRTLAGTCEVQRLPRHYLALLMHLVVAAANNAPHGICFPCAIKASAHETPRHNLTCFTDGQMWQPSRTQLHTHLAGAASAQPHAHTTSYHKHLQAQAMLAAPHSPVLAPAICAASPTTSYSLRPGLTCCHPLPSIVHPASPSEESGSVAPPPRTQTSGHMRVPTLTSCSPGCVAPAKTQKRPSTLLKSAKHTRALQSGVVRGERGTGQSKCAEEAARAFISHLLSAPCDQ